MNQDKWKEVSKEEGNYAVILHAGQSECSTYFYKSKEDMEWALRNSWFDPRDAIPVKIISYDIKLHE